MQTLLASLAKAAAKQLPGVSIVYRLFADSVFTPTTANELETYHDVAIHHVVQNMVTVADVSAGQGALQMGDIKLGFPVSDLSAHLTYARSGDLSTSDLVVIGTTTYRVISLETYGNGTMLRVMARRQG